MSFPPAQNLHHGCITSASSGDATGHRRLISRFQSCTSDGRRHRLPSTDVWSGDGEAMNHAPNLVPPTQTPHLLSTTAPQSRPPLVPLRRPLSLLTLLRRRQPSSQLATISSVANCSHPPLLLDTLSLSCSLSSG
ncbi:hypothetical protein L2E82_18256 [Cichorium intybus]|uniref:Uncharacterized protein n=1 Tax=Cichorium intybus TaxID=13427 RepID=A0ACB9F928_CICIN|nr:hypothetical protein L2E82_18256 [Cichorium intybus]